MTRTRAQSASRSSNHRVPEFQGPPAKARAVKAGPPAAPADGFDGGPTAQLSQGVDPFSVTADQLATLRTGNDQAKRLATTIVNAQKNFGALKASGARITISANAGNGGQPVVTIVPAGFDPTKPARVHTHYHGFYSTVAAPVTDDAQVTKNALQQAKVDPQTVLVLPECASAPTSSKTTMGKTDWSNVQSVNATTDAALAAAGLDVQALTVKERLVSAHSGGGRALGYAMQHTPDGSGLACDRLELEDCAYGAPRGALSCVAGVQALLGTSAGARLKSVTYIEGTGGNDEKPSADLVKALGARYSHTHVPSHFAAVTTTFVHPPLS